jgi:hypothetical protein
MERAWIRNNAPGAHAGCWMRVLLTVAAFAGMIALCIVGWPWGGAGGLIGGALGFLVRLGGRGLDWGERLGNGYVGALMGMPVGLLLGGVYMLGWPALQTALHAAARNT